MYNSSYCHNLLFCLHAHCRSLKQMESSATDDVMSASTAALMQEQVDSLSDTDAGKFICLPLHVVLLLLSHIIL